MKRLALALFVLAALPALAADPATNAPAATPVRADVNASVLAKLDRIIVPEFEFKNADICDVVSRLGDCSREFDDETAASERGETFERWRFTILPDIVGRSDLIGEWMDFFGQLGVSWPPGTYAERSGDDGLVVLNTRENLTTIRMALGALSVKVLQGEPVVLEDAPATNAPAATLEQLLAEPWRKRLSPDADPVAEMRKIGTLDAFADTRVLFLGPGVCVTRLRNDPGHIAYARAQSRLVRYLFRGTRPAAGVDFARGGSSRLLAFDALPREGDPEFPRPVRAVPFEFDAFAPADAPEDLVVRLPGEDRWVRVPGLGEVAMPRLSAADPATNAPAATLARAEADLQGETFERWRFTIRPDLVTGRPAVIDGLMAFLGRPSIWWPPGSSMERSGDDGFVVLNTRENLDTIRMILGELSVNVDRGEPVVLEDSPATNAPDTAASDCARFLESAFREIDPGTNGAPAAVVLGDLGWDAAIKSSDPLDSAEDMWLPKAGERIVITDTTELTLLIGKHQFVRIARLPLDTSLPESLDEKDRAVADAVGGPLLVVERRENYSSFGHAERNVAIRHYILPTGAREGHPFHPPAGAPARFLFADLAPAHAEPVPHAESAEEEPHAESAETAEP